MLTGGLAGPEAHKRNLERTDRPKTLKILEKSAELCSWWAGCFLLDLRGSSLYTTDVSRWSPNYLACKTVAIVTMYRNGSQALKAQKWQCYTTTIATNCTCIILEYTSSDDYYSSISSHTYAYTYTPTLSILKRPLQYFNDIRKHIVYINDWRLSFMRTTEGKKKGVHKYVLNRILKPQN